MTNFSIRELPQDEHFDPLSLSAFVPFTQAQFYGSWQKSLGRKVRRFLITQGKQNVAYFQLIKYALLFEKSYLYAPYGPVVKNFSAELCRYLREQLLKIAKEEQAVFVRLDFSPKPADSFNFKKFFKKAPAYTYHSSYFQPRTEWFLSLNKSEEQLLKEMHHKGRYSIKLSAKNGVKVETITKNFEKYFEIFYELMLETANRNGFFLHPQIYYKSIFESLQSLPDAYLVIARYKTEASEKILAMDLIIVYGKVANYVFGASSTQYRNFMPTYLAQWVSICQAKRLGCESYNFGAIAGGKTDKNWQGLNAFKQKFGGREFRHSEFYDLIVQPFWYTLYSLRKLLISQML